MKNEMFQNFLNRSILGLLKHAGSISGLKTDVPDHPGALESAKHGTLAAAKSVTLALTRPEIAPQLEYFVKVARVLVSGHAIKLVAATHCRIASRSPREEARRVVASCFGWVEKNRNQGGISTGIISSSSLQSSWC